LHFTSTIDGLIAMEIVFEFVCGIADGLRVASPAREAEQFFHLTRQGALGARLRGYSDEVPREGSPPRLHTYEVVERLEHGSLLRIRAKHLPRDG
jgi:hypothetical protein